MTYLLTNKAADESQQSRWWVPTRTCRKKSKNKHFRFYFVWHQRLLSI